MRFYSSYKESGVEWIGDIPSHWEIQRNKYFTIPRSDKSVGGKEELLSVSEHKGVIPRKDIRDEDNLSRSDSLEGYRIVHKGDLVSNIMLMWKRGLGVSHYYGIVSPSYSVFSFIDSEPWYYHYLFRTDQYVTEFRKNSTGVIDSRLRLYDDKFGFIYSHFPPLPEQTQIVSFLDNKTQKIDQLIDLTEKKIGLLKEQRTSLINHCVTKGLNPNVEMKESGVEWIGEIPLNWTIQPIKYLMGKTKDSIVDGPFGSSINVERDYGEYEIPVIRTVNITDNKFNSDNLKFMREEKYEKLKRHNVIPGDVLFSKVGTIGNVCLFPVQYEKGILSTTGSCRMRVDNEKVFNEFLVYLLISSKHHFILLSGQNVQPFLNMTTIKDVRLPVPPVKIQHEIVGIINSKVGKIESSICIEGKRIDFLKEYRQSLISEVVTGKIDVRDWKE
jgi:type I restriction enzyme, S subunit